MPKSLDVNGITEKLKNIAVQAARYRLPAFIVLLLVIYGFVYFRIQSYNSAQPNSGSVAQAGSPVVSAHIDKAAAQQLESLQNNNVNIQALFSQARTNPFQDN